MDKASEALIGSWQKRNIQGFYCQTKAEAVSKVLSLIPSGAGVGISGSVTLDQLCVVRDLESSGRNVFNQYKAGLSREESLKARKQGAEADYYLSGVNAISASGELVFFSAFGHRIAGISNAPNVVIVSGTNKITPDLESAIKRAREYATPLNCKRLKFSTPCFDKGVCDNGSCLFPEYRRMCCQVLIIEAEAVANRLKVVLVGQELGF